MEYKRKATIAYRWFEFVSDVPGAEYSLSPAKKVIYSYIHHHPQDVNLCMAYDALRELHDEEKQRRAKCPSEEALDHIVAILDAPDWEYPGQVVRDVALAIHMDFDVMAAKLRAKETK